MKYDDRDVLEMLKESNAIEGVYDSKSLDQALHAWHYIIQFKRLTPLVVKNTHKILSMYWNDLSHSEKGQFRKIPVWVGRREGLKANLIKSAIDLWCNKINKRSTKLDSIALHVEYEKIHPFVDGNGRTGRIFLNWTRLMKTHEPIMIIKESERYGYYSLFDE